MVLEQFGIYIEKKESSFLLHTIKINSQWITDLKVKDKTLTLTEENIGHYFSNWWLWWTECLCPPKIYVLKYTPPNRVVLGDKIFRKWLVHEGTPSWMGLVPFYRV